MLRRLALALLLLPALWGGAALGVGVDPPLADPAAEARAHAIARSLRCLVCQNQSIEDSNAPLARDLRQIVRERVAAGDSDDEVRRYLVARYGDWVLLKPPFKAGTAVLWIGPFVLLLLAGAGGALYLRRRPAAGAAAPLSDEERARLAALLDDAGNARPDTRSGG
jgi:cytochrome c-type biogenesis protein CcmH